MSLTLSQRSHILAVPSLLAEIKMSLEGWVAKPQISPSMWLSISRFEAPFFSPISSISPSLVPTKILPCGRFKQSQNQYYGTPHITLHYLYTTKLHWFCTSPSMTLQACSSVLSPTPPLQNLGFSKGRKLLLNQVKYDDAIRLLPEGRM